MANGHRLIDSTRTRDPRYKRVRNPQLYFGVMTTSDWRQNFKACVEPPPGYQANMMLIMSLATKTSGSSSASKWQLLTVSRFTPFYISGGLQTQPPCAQRVSCRHLFTVELIE